MATAAPGLRIVFLGTPDFAVPALEALLASRHDVVGVVTQPDRPRGRGQRLQPPPVKVVAQRAAVPCWQPERLRQPGFFEDMRALSPDLGVVAAYGKILPRTFLDIPRLGMINLHASLLPRWRGASPIQHAVMAGDAVTGVTIMRVVEALDAGAMILKGERTIGPEETAAEVEAGLAPIGARLMIEALERIAAGTAVDVPQDEQLVTLAPRLAKESGAIDWHRPAPALANFVRGLHPWPLARTALEGQTLTILRAVAVAGEHPDAVAGTVFEARGDSWLVGCGARTLLRLVEVQPEGRRAMSARDFLAGHRLAAGAILGPQGPS
jgi:methionyl-tRNA formyltransferase